MRIDQPLTCFRFLKVKSSISYANHHHEQQQEIIRENFSIKSKNKRLNKHFSIAKSQRKRFINAFKCSIIINLVSKYALDAAAIT